MKHWGWKRGGGKGETNLKFLLEKNSAVEQTEHRKYIDSDQVQDQV